MFYISLSCSSLLSILRKKKDTSSEIPLVEKDSSEKPPGEEKRSNTSNIISIYKPARLKSSAFYLKDAQASVEINKCKDYIKWSCKTVIMSGWYFKVSLLCRSINKASAACSCFFLMTCTSKRFHTFMMTSLIGVKCGLNAVVYSKIRNVINVHSFT